MRQFLVTFIIIFNWNCGLFQDKPSADEKAVSDTIEILEELVAPTATAGATNNSGKTAVGVKVIKNTLAFCEKTIAKNEKDLAASQKTILKLQKEITELQEQLADTREKSGQVDFINKMLMVAAAAGIGYLLFQFLPVIKRLLGIG